MARHYYINFYFRELIVHDKIVQGIFDAPDSEVKCEFKYNMGTHEYEIWNCSEAVENIIPLPFWWLDKKLEENGKLNSLECKISY